ncbi:MAG: hypothetical protein RIR51_1497 [Bacteroidota bacterium]|jgi:cysteine desulfurase
MKPRIYLDNAATTPMDPLVMEEILPLMKDFTANPSSIHSDGRKAKVLIENSRKKIAQLINAAPAEVFFTSGGTEADNTVLFGTDRQVIISSKMEHHAVLHSLDILEKLGKKILYIRNDDKGNIDLNHLEELLKENNPALISIMHSNNEIGNINPVEEIAKLAVENNALFHSDTVQTMGYFSIDTQTWGVDYLVGAGHKFYGPKGIGFLYARAGKAVHPYMHGGSQERNMRGGTENIYGIVGIAKALEIAYANLEKDAAYILGLKRYFIEKLKLAVPNIQFNGLSGQMENAHYRLVNVLFPNRKDGDMLLFNLDIEGISASGGSACSSGTSIGSHVLAELTDNLDGAAVRFSFSKYNTKEEIDRVIEVIREE